MNLRLASLSLLSLALVSGCEEEDCQYAGAGAEPALAAPYRNPATGLCEATGGGGGEYWDCDGPHRLPPEQQDQAQPDWALCYQGCEGLGEQTCLESAGCRAVYVEDAFHECWGTAPSGPIQGGDCTLLGAYDCSRHDDCVAHHAPGAPVGEFQRCASEPEEESGCYSDQECAAGEHCNAAEVCLPPPDCDAGGACPDVCYGYCVPDDNPGPGSCAGEVACDEPPPACPDGTLPGRRDGCWTGYCIPIDQCDALPACEGLGEAGCVQRADCSAIYEGVDCTCDDTGCTCADWLYSECAPA